MDNIDRLFALGYLSDDEWAEMDALNASLRTFFATVKASGPPTESGEVEAPRDAQPHRFSEPEH